MYAADQIIDIGPGAGVHGGHVIAQGTAEEIKECEPSITGQYLSGRKQIKTPKTRRKQVKGKVIEVCNATENNLKNISVKFPLGLCPTFCYSYFDISDDAIFAFTSDENNEEGIYKFSIKDNLEDSFRNPYVLYNSNHNV